MVTMPSRVCPRRWHWSMPSAGGMSARPAYRRCLCAVLILHVCVLHQVSSFQSPVFSMFVSQSKPGGYAGENVDSRCWNVEAPGRRWRRMRRLVPARFWQRRRRARRRAPVARQRSAAATAPSARQHCSGAGPVSGNTHWWVSQGKLCTWKCRPTALHCRLLTGAGGTQGAPPLIRQGHNVLRLPCRQQTSQTCSSLYCTTRVTRPPFRCCPTGSMAPARRTGS